MFEKITADCEEFCQEMPPSKRNKSAIYRRGDFNETSAKHLTEGNDRESEKKFINCHMMAELIRPTSAKIIPDKKPESN